MFDRFRRVNRHVRQAESGGRAVALLAAILLIFTAPASADLESTPEEVMAEPQTPPGVLALPEREPAAPAPTQALGPGAITLGLDFELSRYPTDSGFLPPDTMGSVGPDHIVEIINGRFSIYDKETGTTQESRSLNSFWTNRVGLTIPPFNDVCVGGPDGTCSVSGDPCDTSFDCRRNGTFDPRIVYDPTIGRWFANSLDRTNPGTGDNNIYIARSDTADPRGGWDGVLFDADTVGNPEFHDYDTLSIDADALTTCTQDFNDGGNESCYTIPKADLLLSPPSVANMTRFEATPPNLPVVRGSIQPAVSFETSNARTPLLGVDSGSVLRGDILNPGAAGATLGPIVGLVGDPGHATPPDARQPHPFDPSVTIENVAPRFVSNVVEQGSSLWAVHAVEGTDTPANSALRWYEIDEATDTVLQTGLIENANEDFHEPSIAVNQFGDVVIGYTCSGPNLAPAACISIGDTSGGVTTFDPSMIVQAGDGHYYQDVRGRNRWGDYSATVVDPLDDCTFWTFQEFVAVSAVGDVGPADPPDRPNLTEDGSWGTQLTEIVINDCAEADVSITKADDPDPVVAGTNLTYTLSVSSDGPSRAFAVTAEDLLPADVTYVSAAGANWSCSLSGSTVECDWTGGNPAGSLSNNGQTADDITIVAAVNPSMVFEGRTSLTDTASAESDTPDPDTSNNEVTEQTTVVAETDLEIESFVAVDPPDEILVADDVLVTLEKEVSNHGPSWPVNTAVTVDATPPFDSSVTPVQAIQPVLIPELDVPVTVQEQFTINCGAASDHVWSFANEIEPTDASTTDPNPANNTAILDLAVECVVPVLINFKPGSDPNSKQRLKGVGPVAVLTTVEGEAGLPLAFDATTIDPLSVRFGPREIFDDPALGATETHRRGHIEDSYELDETTRDGDLDMVLHFKMSEAGLEPGETEVCVKGSYTDATGTHQFFGCDAIRLPPGSN